MVIPFIVLVLFFVSVIIAYHMGQKYSGPISVPSHEATSSGINQLLNFIDLSRYEIYAHGLNGIKQGILVVNKDKRVEQALSPITDEILVHAIQNQPIVDVLFYTDEEEKESVSGILDRIFSAIDDEERQSFIQLLPEKVKIFDRFLGLTYFFPEHSKFFYVYLEDQSVFIERELETDRRLKQLEMVTKVLSQIGDYSEVITSFDHFVHHEIAIWCHESSQTQEALSLIRQKIHSFKMEFKKFDMLESLEQIESFEQKLLSVKEDLSPLEILEEIERLKPLEIIESDANLVRGYQKEELLQSNYLSVDINVIHELENMLNKLPDGNEKKVLLERFVKIKHVSIKDVIKRFDKYARDLAVNMNKKVNPIVFEGYDVYFDEHIYKDLIKGFVELVANAIEHGIEFPADRYRNNKAEYGTLKLTATRNENEILLRFEDDGRGVDVNKVKDILYEHQLLPFDEIVALEDDAVAQFIFSEGLTTNLLTKTNTSKGMGLFMLKEKLEQMGGGISVHTVFNRYTVFEVRVPIAVRIK